MSVYANWREEYRRRRRPAGEALDVIREGDLVCMPVITPAVIIAAFQERARHLKRVDIRMLAPTAAPLFGPDGPAGEKEIELFIGDIMRPAHDAKVATYLPNTFMLGMKAFDAGRPEARMPDVLLIPCSAPNDAGYVHFGPHMWHRKAYARRCPTTVAYIDPNMTPVHGDIWMHVSEIAVFVEGAINAVDEAAILQRIDTLSPAEHRPALKALLARASRDQLGLLQDLFHAMPPDVIASGLGFAEVDPASHAIAAHLREIIRDGDTIQVGVGQPSSLMFLAGAFDDAEHLGLHTELGSPGLARLWQRGILDNSLKAIHRGKSVAVAWSGCDADDYKIIEDNPAFELYDPDFLLHPLYMAQNRQMTSINSAIAVDLLGQIASEDRFGGHMVNGTGGQPDTHLAASLCRGGRAITVMRSTAIEGTLSKVVAQHEKGTLVTIPRYLADTIVTEYGVARLLDKNHRQRADELVSISHPDFRADLRREAAELWGQLEF